MKKTISFCSVKGGTGKSTLSILTALTLSAQGNKVLFIDLDPQNSSTFFFVGDPGHKSILKFLWEILLKSKLLKQILILIYCRVI
jgi:ATPases involved in chromosome partitioning